MYDNTEKTVLPFGSFDDIHPGHEYLISEAQKYGSKIIIVVAQDELIAATKGQLPLENIRIRIEKLHNKFSKIIALAGDREKGTWTTIKKYRPETIIVGYDQNSLYDALISIQEEYNFEIIKIASFHPKKYKSSILRKKKNL